METFVKIIAATAILGVLVSWITYGLLAWMRESAPWLLQEPGWRPDLPVPARKKTRIVPRGKGKPGTLAGSGKSAGPFSHLPRFARRPPITGAAAPERNWIS